LVRRHSAFQSYYLKKKIQQRRERITYMSNNFSDRESDTDNNTCIPLNMEGFAYRAAYSSSFCSKKHSSIWHWTVAASLAATLSVTDTVIKKQVLKMSLLVLFLQRTNILLYPFLA
jgi:hypothetical protein